MPLNKRKQWFPLESNPEIMNDYIKRLGFPIEIYSFCDVLSIDEWALDMIHKPVVAVVMLYPIKDESEEYRKEETEKIDKNGQYVSKQVYFMKQTIGNACGTIGILHAIGNIHNQVTFTKGSFLDKFIRKTIQLDPNEIATILENDDELEEVHTHTANEGQSEQLESVSDPINTHFICFTVVDNYLYELDGRKKYPINHGVSNKDNLLKDSCKIISEFMIRDPNELRFTILALASTLS